MSENAKGIVLLLMLGVAAGAAAAPRWQLPSGYTMTEWAEVPNARSLALGDRGTVFVGTRTDGRVFALRDVDGDGRAERRWVLAEGLDMPNGVAFRDGDLYLAESGAIWRYPGIERHLDAPPEPTLVLRLKAYRHHGWRYIAFGPDDRLYVSLGAPCNICDPGELGAIWRLKRDGSGLEPYALGVRNSVGMTLGPDGKLWFTDNGRDWMGDDLPPDELNRADAPGQHFGYPYCHGGDVPDPEFGDQRGCDDRFVPPVQRLGAHVASLGLRFYRGDVLIAEHGSWNRSTPVGYRISRVRLGDDGKAVAYEDFVTGWLAADGKVSGRPVDLLALPDGSLLVSDDAAGRIWRLHRR